MLVWLQLFDHCLAANTYGDGTGCDNMTCIIIVLHHGDKKDNAAPDSSSLPPSKRGADDVEENLDKRPRVDEGGEGEGEASSTTGWKAVQVLS